VVGARNFRVQSQGIETMLAQIAQVRGDLSQAIGSADASKTGGINGTDAFQLIRLNATQVADANNAPAHVRSRHMQLQANSKPAPTGEPHPFRGAVPAHEKLLLLAVLVVAAGWISFRVALMLFATLG
jgi:hypothetical protein